MRGSLILLLALMMGITIPGNASAQGRIHMYKQPDGSRLYTDQKRRPDQGFTYLGSYGRQPYRVSCAGYRPEIMRARMNTYRRLVDQYAGEYGVDARLVAAVMRVESCLDRNAVSRAGAKGLMQLMPATARELGVQDIFDPAENIRGGIAYLSQMLARFDNQTELALAAYNAGPGAVERFGGVPPFKETRSYLKRVALQYRREGGGELAR